MLKLVGSPTTIAAVALFALMSSGCADGPTQNIPAWGGAVVRVYSQLPSSYIASVTVTITADDIDPPIVVPLTKVGDQWVVNLAEIPAGTNRTFTLSVLDDTGREIYSGVATGVNITAGQTAAVTIGGQETNPASGSGNISPVIDALVASAIAVAPGGGVDLSLDAHDPDAGDTLSFSWTSSGGVLEQVDTAATSWTAPDIEGTYRVTVKVQDQHQAQTTAFVDITVRSASDGGAAATISVTLNNWPVVGEVTSTQGRIDIGDSTVLDCTAIDADDDPLTYAWSTDDGCTGTFDAMNVKSPTFTMGAILPTDGSCAFTVIVSDGRGGTGSSSLTVTAAPPPVVIVPPQVISSSQSVPSAVAGETVTLWVLASDPQGSAMTFAWSADRGTFGTPVDLGAGSQQVVWTAPLNFVADIQIQVTVTNAGNASTVQSFTVTKTQAPSGGGGWTTDPSFYGAGDGCDCGVGAWDPDCATPGQVQHGCNNGQACVQSGQLGVCQTMMTPAMPEPAPPSTPPAGWTCDPSYYDANDGCDCGCGAFDPDCGKPNQRLYDCNVGQYCGPAGACENLPSQ